MQKIFVDVDDTLILWPDDPGAELEINWKLVDTLVAGLLAKRYDITIWSGTGRSWAKYWGNFLFPTFNLPYGSKEEREYLKNFERVFLPDEFVRHSTTINLLAKTAILGDSGNETPIN